MKLLIVSSTRKEIEPLEEYLLDEDREKNFNKHGIELMITGPGSPFTAYHLGKTLPADNWDLAINLGICGSFKTELSIGTTVNVTMDMFGDIGAEDGENFHDLFKLGLLEFNEFPFENGVIRNWYKEQNNSLTEISEVRGVTVNTVSGNDLNISRMVRNYAPDIESMEGAAFMYCCRKQSVPCLQIRTVSNYVEKRDKSKWQVNLGIANLNNFAIKLLREILQGKDE
jgi:futalosine hydrolase